ncbi:MAG: amidohydrolase family protein [Anaerolineae bacterium]|nr:amidohydrolase family protein [Anaerolineae bacterium]MDW8071550.1 amidohydrolase family protein [Anaerolineae bacterium]
MLHIDAHVHYMPPLTPEELDALCHREPYWGLLLRPPAGARSSQGWASAERMLQDMDAAGVDYVVVQAQYRRTHESCVEHNNQLLALVRRWPQHVIAFATVQPMAGAQARDELRRCLDNGMRGVGELNPYAQGFGMDQPDFLRLVEMCIACDVPLSLHVSEEVGRYYLGKSTTPLRHYYWLACRYPELKLILAHWGGGLFFYELMPNVRKALRNVWYDTAASPLLYPTAEIFEVALRCIDHRKLLFGSDYPLLLFPRRQSEPDLRTFRAQVQSLLPPEVGEAVLGGNAARLLRLDGVSESATASSEMHNAEVEQRAAEAVEAPVHGFMAVTMVAEHWPQTRAVFERYGIPWRDSPVPFWEPIVQAAAARGYGPTEQQRLLDELNAAIV